MRKILILSLSIFLAGCSIPFFGGKKSGLKITATPGATVILDGKQVGQTPFDQQNLKPKQYKLQLIPQSGQPWETTITLHDNLQAVIERIFGQNDQESEGYVMELEPVSNKSESQLSIVTIPDPATVRIDGQPKGFAPITTALASEGSHEVVISSAGYNEKKIPLSIPKGYQLHLTVQLARAQLAQPTPAVEGDSTPSATPTPTPVKGMKPTPTPTPTSTPKKGVTPTPTPTPSKMVSATPTPPERPYVEILPTGTKATADAPRDNWLRVRSEGVSSAEVIAYVYAGETYKFLEVSDTGWDKIDLGGGKQGWISGQYAKLYR